MATPMEGKSLSQLERETEHTRADLIHTVDELPPPIKATVGTLAVNLCSGCHQMVVPLSTGNH
jgi:hypothetical protein